MNIVLTKTGKQWVIDAPDRRIYCMNIQAVDYHLAKFFGCDRETSEFARFTAECAGQAVVSVPLVSAA